MTRKTKNIISILIILLLCISIVFTGYLKTKTSNTNNNLPNMSQNGSQPPEMPNGNNQAEPPERPEGEVNGELGNGNLNIGEPPEKPDGDNNMGNPPEIPNNNGSMEQIGKPLENNTDSNYIYLVLFGIESLSLSIIILYLIMSGFNKKSLKETFANTDKILIYALGVILLASGLTFTENLIASQKSLNNKADINLEAADKEDVVLDESNTLTSNLIDLSSQKQMLPLLQPEHTLLVVIFLILLLWMPEMKMSK